MFVSCHPKSTIAVAIVISCLLGIGVINYEKEEDFAGKWNNTIYKGFSSFYLANIDKLHIKWGLTT